jgi:Raf kinase inhibitor-like YbhB/YbcL family protein
MLSSLLTALLVVQGGTFTLTSPDLPDGKPLPNAQVFNSLGCQGDNRSPALEWKGAPAGTKSFAVTVYDPDAPTGSGWWHWVIFNIPATVTSLPAGAGDSKSGRIPQGAVQSRTDFGGPGFGGACPPPGDKPHRYIFTVHALKVDSLPLDADVSGAMVGFYLGQNSLGKASFTRTYGR